MNPAALQRTLQEGLAHHRAGRLAQAAALYDQVRRAAPKLFDGVHLAGVVAYQQGKSAEAVTLLTKALRLDPKSSLCAMRLGLALLACGKPAEAERHLRDSISKQPTQPEAWNALGLTLRALGRPAEAIDCWQQAIKLSPIYVEAHDLLGAVLADTEGFAAGIPHFRRALELNAKYASSWCNLGLAYAQTGALADAKLALERALQLDPNLHKAKVGRALVHQQLNEISEAAADYGAVVAIQPRNWEARSARLLCLNYLDTVSKEELFAEHQAFGEAAEAAAREAKPDTFGKAAGESVFHVSTEPKKILRVAFLSPDLRNHSVAYFLEPLLQHLDRSRFEIVLYHDHAVVDATSERLRGLAAVWRHFAGQPDVVVESQIRADAPDILVDLAGHTGFNRLPLLARRLAPVQITYLGYPNTTGVKTIDYRFTDSISDPIGPNDAFYTEQLVRFSPTAWTYRPPASAPAVEIPPCANGAAVTFCSFNNFSKVGGETFALWTRVLAAVPGSRLVLKGHGLHEPAFQARLKSKFDAMGIKADRLAFLGRVATLEAHLALYNKVDIALDSFPYHGTTTTCEALWMGRPVVTLAGDRHASRVGVSILSTVGHPEWIASSADDYVSIAAQLARDPERLRQHSLTLRQTVKESPLLDAAAQAERFGNALISCFQDSVAGARRHECNPA